MLKHFRASLWLLVLTLFVCSFLYPLALWATGRTLFPTQAEGSLLRDAQGRPVGSRLIGQNFKGDEFFQPRPSATAENPYNAAASGATNWGASNYLLRDRVARQLGPIVKYRNGRSMGPDIDKWFQKLEPGFVARWAREHPGLAEQWVKDNPEVTAEWLHKDVKEVKEASGESAKAFFESYGKAHPGTWPTVEEKTIEGKSSKRIQPAREGPDIQAYFFDLWRQEHPHAELEEVPADMVMASASGLDPHITLKNALYQLKQRVGDAQAKKLIEKVEIERKTKIGAPQREQIEAQVRQEIETLLHEKADAPLGGLAGVPLINVLEVNLALPDQVTRVQQTIK